MALARLLLLLLLLGGGTATGDVDLAVHATRWPSKNPAPNCTETVAVMTMLALMALLAGATVRSWSANVVLLGVLVVLLVSCAVLVALKAMQPAPECDAVGAATNRTVES